MKYSYEEKLNSVLSVEFDNQPLSQVAKELGTHPEHLRRWVKRYILYGEKGLRMRQGSYTGEFKMSVIGDMHKNHLSLREVALKFGIPSESTVLQWNRIYSKEGSLGLCQNKRGNMKKHIPPENSSSNNLQEELEYLRTENAYLKKLRVLVKERIAHESGKKSTPSKD